MPHIQQLSSHVADLIAAGEVVERPASVVKELVENAIDAGASAIVVEIQRGGMGLIRVTDNGCGIAPEELPTAFLRHATSKLRTAEDLAKIGTLGFRGEALAAISAVSRVDVLTRRPGDTTGSAIHGEGGHMEPVREEGAPEGTTIRVADLFYNTPARLKFMKKDSAETAAVAGLMQHLALSHPDVSFKFIKENTPVKLQNRHVKRAAAEVIDDVNSFRCLIEAIGQSSGRRLIQQTENIEAGKAPRVLRRLTLRVIKVRRARNHGAHKFPFEIRLSPGAEHLQDF